MKPAYIEGESVDYFVEVANASNFVVDGFVLEEHNGLSQEPNIRIAFTDQLQPKHPKRIFIKKKCDGGMGTHVVGPMQVNLSDPLGLFEFHVVEDQILSIEVYPKIEDIPEIPLKGSLYSQLYGENEVNQPGLSVNFSGIRPYVQGDSLRHVAWKLSSKSKDLLVKEFENAVSSEVTIVLNMNAELHLGVKAQSTWEYGRDIALSVISQQVQKGNLIQFVSNHFYVEQGRGDLFLATVCKQIAEIKPFDSVHLEKLNVDIDMSDIVLKDQMNLIERYAQVIPKGSSLIYIAPYSSTDLKRVMPSFKYLNQIQVEAVAIFIDSRSFMKSLAGKVKWTDLIGNNSIESLEGGIRQLNLMGVRCYKVSLDEPLAANFVKEAQL